VNVVNARLVGLIFPDKGLWRGRVGGGNLIAIRVRSLDESTDSIISCANGRIVKEQSYR
jgi:hypothetical protein